ncbi:MAG: ATP-binding protein, partial [Spartobacteria bacterium]
MQIRVYANRLSIWNPCTLPEGWTLKKLLGPHSSAPHNPAIAHV